MSYAVELAYDGTAYWGWQLQPTAPPANGSAKQRRQRQRPTIQLKLEQALIRVTGLPREALKVQAAGRTDAGVHARGQVAQLFWDPACATPRQGRRHGAPLEPSALQHALNALLPPDIRCKGAKVVPLDFNVRYAMG